MAGQHQNLNNEYNEAIADATHKDDIKALKEWLSFSQLYTKRIAEFPQFSYNMAINQAPTSDVMQHSKSIGKPEAGLLDMHDAEIKPFTWSNIPTEIDPMLVKYASGGTDISGTSSDGEVVAIAATDAVLVVL